VVWRGVQGLGTRCLGVGSVVSSSLVPKTFTSKMKMNMKREKETLTSLGPFFGWFALSWSSHCSPLIPTFAVVIQCQLSPARSPVVCLFAWLYTPCLQRWHGVAYRSLVRDVLGWVLSLVLVST
jgi:hypothetical protein